MTDLERALEALADEAEALQRESNSARHAIFLGKLPTRLRALVAEQEREPVGYVSFAEINRSMETEEAMTPNEERLRKKLLDCKFAAKRALLSESGGSLTVGLQKVMEIVDVALRPESEQAAPVMQTVKPCTEAEVEAREEPGLLNEVADCIDCYLCPEHFIRVHKRALVREAPHDT